MLSTLRSQRVLSVLSGESLSYSFGTADYQTDYYNRFRKNYTTHLSAFKAKLNKLENDNPITATKPQSKVYSHPYHNEHTPIVFSAVKNSELFSEAIGPEQVSAHYENFMVARKFTITFWVGALFLSFTASIADLSWILKSTMIPWFYWFYVMWFFMEGRKSLFKPLLNRWYRRVASNDCYNFEVYYNENIEVKMRKMIAHSRSQIEYGYVHKDYKDIKAEVMNNFLIQEYTNLQKHINDRALNVLKTTQQYEESNRDAIFQDVLAKTLADLDRALVGEKGKEVRSRLFESAVAGIADGKMEYKNDPILPLVQESLKSNISSITFKTPKEQQEMISLTNEQLKSIRDADQAAKNSYLHTEPTIDPSIKAMESVKQVIQNWGK